MVEGCGWRHQDDGVGVGVMYGGHEEVDDAS